MPTTAPPTRYCRRCGYSLAGLSEPRCPECGRAFDPARPRTTDASPGRRRVRRAAPYFLAPVVVAGLLAAAVGWLRHDWSVDRRAEARLLAWGGEHAGFQCTLWERRIGPAWLARLLGGRTRWLERVGRVEIYLRDAAEFDPADVAPLHALTRLDVYNLTGRPLSPRPDVARSYLTQLTDLEVLCLYRVDLTPTDLAAIGRMTRLEQLYLNGSVLPVHGRGTFAGLKRLVFVELNGTELTDDDLNEFAGATRVQQIVLSNTRVTDAGMGAIRRWERLDRVELCNDDVTDDGLVRAGLGAKAMLNEVRLSGTRVDDGAVTLLAGDAGLTRLDLSQTGITAACGPALARLTRLTTLSVADARFGDAGVAALAPLTNLENLDLSRSGCDDRGLAPCGRMPKLDWLGLDGNPVTAAGLRRLDPAAGSLHSIYARHSRVTAADVPSLKRVLPQTQFYVDP